MREKSHSKLDGILSENLAEQWAQSRNLFLQLRDASEALVQVVG